MKPRMQIGILVLVAMMGLAFGGQIIIKPVNSTNSSQGFVVLVNGNLSLGYSGSMNVLVLGANNIANQTFTITAPSDNFKKVNQAFVLGYGQSISNSIFNFTISSPANNAPTKKIISVMNGESNQLVNNVTVISPRSVSADLEFNVSNRTIVSNSVLAPNVSVSILVNPPKPLDVNSICEGNWNSTVVIENSTYNAIFTCEQNKPFNLEYNITPSENSTITFGSGLLQRAFYGSILNITPYGIRVNVLYPRLNVDTVIGANYVYSNQALNFTVRTINGTNVLFNQTQAQQIYLETYGKNCFNGMMNGNTFMCIQQSPNSTSLTSVCSEQAILDHNVTEGYDTCLIDNKKLYDNETSSQGNTINTDNGIISKLSNENYENYSSAQAAQKDNVPWNDVFGFLALVVVLIFALFIYMYKSGGGPFRREKR